MVEQVLEDLARIDKPVSARAISLLYHDVIVGDNPDVSGFPGSNAAEYKLSRDEFSHHLRAIQAVQRTPVVTVHDLDFANHGPPPILLTFDDGGCSAWEYAAPMLEEYGWRGCFFITTDRIGQPAFLSRHQIRELHSRGHAIGSHSCSHPSKISDCSREQLLDEWQRSLHVLEEILGEPVSIASIPGGFYSREVVETAYTSGVRTMFTSEPIQKIENIGGCVLVGRFSIKRGDPSTLSAEFVQGNRILRFRRYAYWNLKKLAKALAGPVYAWVRTEYLARKQRQARR